jgi:hypothetical protein
MCGAVLGVVGVNVRYLQPLDSSVWWRLQIDVCEGEDVSAVFAGEYGVRRCMCGHYDLPVYGVVVDEPSIPSRRGI